MLHDEISTIIRQAMKESGLKRGGLAKKVTAETGLAFGSASRVVHSLYDLPEKDNFIPNNNMIEPGEVVDRAYKVAKTLGFKEGHAIYGLLVQYYGTEPVQVPFKYYVPPSFPRLNPDINVNGMTKKLRDELKAKLVKISPWFEMGDFNQKLAYLVDYISTRKLGETEVRQVGPYVRRLNGETLQTIAYEFGCTHKRISQLTDNGETKLLQFAKRAAFHSMVAEEKSIDWLVDGNPIAPEDLSILDYGRLEKLSGIFSAVYAGTNTKP